MQLIYKNKAGCASYDENFQILIYKSNMMIINHKTDLFKNLLENTLSLVNNLNIVGEIVDHSELSGNFRQVLDYLIYDYYPKAKMLGINKAA